MNVLSPNGKEIVNLDNLDVARKLDDKFLIVTYNDRSSTFKFKNKQKRDAYFNQLASAGKALTMYRMIMGLGTQANKFLYSPRKDFILNTIWADRAYKASEKSIVFSFEHVSYSFIFKLQKEQKAYFDQLRILSDAMKSNDVINNGLPPFPADATIANHMNNHSIHFLEDTSWKKHVQNPLIHFEDVDGGEF